MPIYLNKIIGHRKDIKKLTQNGKKEKTKMDFIKKLARDNNFRLIMECYLIFGGAYLYMHTEQIDLAAVLIYIVPVFIGFGMLFYFASNVAYMAFRIVGEIILCFSGAYLMFVYKQTGQIDWFTILVSIIVFLVGIRVLIYSDSKILLPNRN